MKENNKQAGHSVFVAISGGVDSAVAAALLQKQGYHVTGVFMKNWSGEEFGLEDQCPWKADQESAKSVCAHLGIPFKTYNFEKEYREGIITDFFHEYRAGRTPNPDILCNQLIKFGTFLERAEGEGAEYIATGHYAGNRMNPDGSFDLLRGKDIEKDQSYFLYRLNQKQLSKTLFPLAEYRKAEVRKIAKELKLPNATRKDSQGICFLGKIDVREFLEHEIKPQVGPIVDIDIGKKVGEHNGVWFYTLGQREGIGVGGTGEPYFVAEKDTKTNTLFVALGKDNPRLYISALTLEDLHFINEGLGTDNAALTCQLRYRQKAVECTVRRSDLVLQHPVWLTSEGQSAVLYSGNRVVGGGIIARVEGVSR